MNPTAQRKPLPDALPGRRWRGLLWIYPLTFTLWALTTLAVFAFILQQSIGNREREFIDHSEAMQAQLRDKLRANEAVLYGFASFLGASGDDDLAGVANYASSVLERYPHIYVLEVVRRVSRAEVPAFVAAMRRKGYPDFHLRQYTRDAEPHEVPLGDRDVYYPVVLMAPDGPTVGRVIGLDIGTIDAVIDGVRHSDREGVAVSSDPFRLIEGGLAYIMFRPVIRSVARVDAAGSASYALLLVRASDLAPPPASLLPQVRQTITYLGNGADGKGTTTLFDFAAEPADAISRALLPTLRFERELTAYSQPLRFVVERQVTFSDLDLAALTLAGLVSALSLALLFAYLRAQMKARDEIESLAVRLQTLAAGTFEGVVLTAGGTICDANEQLARILGYEREQVIGRQAADFVFAEDRQRVTAGMSEGVTIKGFEHRIRRPDGTVRTVEVNAQNIELAGRPMRLAAIRDVTEKKQAEEELRSAKIEAEQARNAMSHFLAAVSHDLRQPVYALSLFFAEIEKKKGAADPRLYANMRDCIAHLDEMFGNLLDLSRLDAGAVVAEVCTFELAPILTRIVASSLPEAEAKGLSLRLARFDARLQTDPMLFQRIVSNLVANAIRYTQRGGVLIGCRRHRGRMWLEVWDSGIGIAPERIGEIFEEFKQLGNPERDSTKGSGLGLSIVDKTASLLGLKLRVRSRPGRGSLFAVELPLAAGKPDRTATG